MEVVGTEGGYAVLIGGVAEEGQHEGGKVVGIVVMEEETGVALFDEVRHLIAVAAYTWKAKGEGFDENETISLEIAGHAKHITHIVIFRFLVERYLAYKVIAFYWIVYWVLLGTDDI